MAIAISLFVILALSVIAVRVGAVALWLTGVPEHAARFQARSAFTTTGFTTPQAALVVNHPDRRSIISLLMVLGNAGIVSSMAAMILSYIDFEASVETLTEEALWLTCGAALFWLLCLSKRSDRVMTRFARWCLQGRLRSTAGVEDLLLLPDGYQVVGIGTGDQDASVADLLSQWRKAGRQITALGVIRADDSYDSAPLDGLIVRASDRLILYGRARDLEGLQEAK